MFPVFVHAQLVAGFHQVSRLTWCPGTAADFQITCKLQVRPRVPCLMLPCFWLSITVPPCQALMVFFSVEAQRSHGKPFFKADLTAVVHLNWPDDFVLLVAWFLRVNLAC